MYSFNKYILSTYLCQALFLSLEIVIIGNTQKPCPMEFNIQKYNYNYEQPGEIWGRYY